MALHSLPRTAEQGIRDPEAWVRWFHDDLMPWWLTVAADPRHGGFFDSLTEDGLALRDGPKTCLAQARVLFTLSHLALRSADPRLTAGADEALSFLMRMRDPASGLFIRALTREGRDTGEPADRVARSYDQAFVVLALATHGRLAPSAPVARTIETVWAGIETHLTDTATGLLLEDDGVTDPAAPGAPLRAQNPHMHLFEAALQAFEMTGDRVWLDRATRIADLGLRHFTDPLTGAVIEFLAPDLAPAPGEAGSRREIGHQCEWAWLLHRHARLSGDGARLTHAARMMGFAEDCGFVTAGPLRGAARDAVDARGGAMEVTCLLWPQTEAGKAFVAWFEDSGSPRDAARARQMLTLVFDRYFAGREAWCNQLDAEGRVLQPVALSRLLYHVALFVTEGERVGLWRVKADTRLNAQVVKHSGGTCHVEDPEGP